MPGYMTKDLVKIFTILSVVVFFTTSCGAQSLPKEFPTSVPITIEPGVPQVTAPPEISIQESVFFKTRYLIQDIINNPISDPKVKEYLSDCEYFMQEKDSSNFIYDGESKCLIMVANKLPEDYTIAVARSVVSEGGEWISYAIFYPYDLSDSTWLRIIYHEAVHMVDYLKNPECLESELTCSINDEFHAHSKTMVLFQDYMIRNGFTVEQISNVDVYNERDPIVQFAIENSISQDDYNIFIQDVILLQATLNGKLRDYLIEVLSPSDGYDM